jgi:hypothetical protein
MNPYLTLSSTLFSIPTTISAYNRHWLLYGISLYMCIISTVYHATKYQSILMLDYPGCYSLVLITAYENWKIKRFHQWMVGCGLCAFLFWGGWMTRRMVFSEYPLERNIFHVTLHLSAITTTCLTSYFKRKYYLLNNHLAKEK